MIIGMILMDTYDYKCTTQSALCRQVWWPAECVIRVHDEEILRIVEE